MSAGPAYADAETAAQIAVAAAEDEALVRLGLPPRGRWIETYGGSTHLFVPPTNDPPWVRLRSIRSACLLVGLADMRHPSVPSEELTRKRLCSKCCAALLRSDLGEG